MSRNAPAKRPIVDLLLTELAEWNSDIPTIEDKRPARRKAQTRNAPSASGLKCIQRTQLKTSVQAGFHRQPLQSDLICAAMNGISSTMSASSGDKSNDGVRELVSLGGEIVGSAAGAALGFMIGGPAGGVVGAALVGGAGAALKDVLKTVGEEISERVLGPREKIRIGGAIAVCATEITRRVEAGDQFRQDGFFTQNANGRSDADEVTESVLIKAQREAEERKIPYLGRLLANIAFDPAISPAMAHQLIKIAEQLTYRQLCLLKLSVVKDQLGLRPNDYRDGTVFDTELIQVLYECMDLYYRGLIRFGDGVLLGLVDVIPGQMNLQGFGANLYGLMRLDEIPNADLDSMIVQFRR